MERHALADTGWDFANDDACLEWLKGRLHPGGILCPKCGRVTKHHKISGRRSFSCDICGHHFHPTVGTIFEKSATPLSLWFRTIQLMSSSRCKASARQVEREMGVTYKTAWRMVKQIESLLCNESTSVFGRPGFNNASFVKEIEEPDREAKNRDLVAEIAQRGGRMVYVKAVNSEGVTLLHATRGRIMNREGLNNHQISMSLPVRRRKKAITYYDILTGNRCFDAWLTIHQFHKAALRVWQRQLRRSRLNPVQMGILFALINLGGSSSIPELGVRVFRESRGVTGLVSRMERAGLVERHRTGNAKRTVRVAITTEGRTAYDELLSSNLVIDVLSHQSEGEIDCLTGCLRLAHEQLLGLIYKDVEIKSVVAALR